MQASGGGAHRSRVKVKNFKFGFQFFVSNTAKDVRDYLFSRLKIHMPHFLASGRWSKSMAHYYRFHTLQFYISATPPKERMTHPSIHVVMWAPAASFIESSALHVQSKDLDAKVRTEISIKPIQWSESIVKHFILIQAVSCAKKQNCQQENKKQLTCQQWVCSQFHSSFRSRSRSIRHQSREADRNPGQHQTHASGRLRPLVSGQILDVKIGKKSPQNLHKQDPALLFPVTSQGKQLIALWLVQHDVTSKNSLGDPRALCAPTHLAVVKPLRKLKIWKQKETNYKCHRTICCFLPEETW